MAHVFISHVEEDASVALSLALGLEEAGFTTWYYERDSLPGVSYLLQTGTAVENSLAVVLLISRNSLSSNQISREVVRAHESGRPVVPVLIDISHVAFQKRQPEWREAIGAATSIRVGDEGVTGVLPRVVAGLRALGVRAKRVASQSPATEKGTPAAAPVQAMPGRTRRTVTIQPRKIREPTLTTAGGPLTWGLDTRSSSTALEALVSLLCTTLSSRRWWPSQLNSLDSTFPSLINPGIPPRAR